MGPGSQGWGCGLGGRSFLLRLSDCLRNDADVSLPSPARVRAPQGLRAELGPRPGRPWGPRRSPPPLPLQRQRRGLAEGRAGAAAAAVPSHLPPARASPCRAPAAAALPRASEPASERARPRGGRAASFSPPRRPGAGSGRDGRG